MRKFWTNKGEKERNQEETSEEIGNLEAEEAIIRDKVRFGRVRNSLMKLLRAKYGDSVANRALWRVNRRMTEGYFDGKTLNDLYRHSTKLIE